MRTTQCVCAGWLIGAVGACMLVAGTARADVTTERPGSILIFPKVVADGTRDTVIQISNTGNAVDQARCFYINGAKGPTGVSQCNETDFLISLTKQQPTIWLAGSGRNPTGLGGLGPGLVPPVPAGFTGALVCAEVDASLAPITMNALKGEATLAGSSLGISKYSGIAISGNTSGTNGDNDLSLDNSEYNACPAASRVNFVATGAPDPVIVGVGPGLGLGNAGVCINDSASPCTTDADCDPGAGSYCAFLTCAGGPNAGGACASDSDCSPGTCNGPALASVTTTVTVLPCNLNMRAQLPTTTTVQVKAWDQTETLYTTSFPVKCWGSFDISASPGPGLAVNSVAGQFGTLELYTGSGSPFLAVIETRHDDSVGNSSVAATNAHVEPQVCVGSSAPEVNGSPCTTNADCSSGGTCPLPTAQIRLPGA
jgi:hypothetical protein